MDYFSSLIFQHDIIDAQHLVGQQYLLIFLLISSLVYQLTIDPNINIIFSILQAVFDLLHSLINYNKAFSRDTISHVFVLSRFSVLLLPHNILTPSPAVRCLLQQHSEYLHSVQEEEKNHCLQMSWGLCCHSLCFRNKVDKWFQEVFKSSQSVVKAIP